MKSLLPDPRCRVESGRGRSGLHGIAHPRRSELRSAL